MCQHAQGLKKAFAVQDYIRKASTVTGERHYLSWLSVRVRKWLLRRTFSVAVGAVCTAAREHRALRSRSHKKADERRDPSEGRASEPGVGPLSSA